MSELISLLQPLVLSDSPECSPTYWSRCGAAGKKGMVENCTSLSFTSVSPLSAEQNHLGSVHYVKTFALGLWQNTCAFNRRQHDPLGHSWEQDWFEEGDCFPKDQPRRWLLGDGCILKSSLLKSCLPFSMQRTAQRLLSLTLTLLPWQRTLSQYLREVILQAWIDLYDWSSVVLC